MTKKSYGKDRVKTKKKQAFRSVWCKITGRESMKDSEVFAFFTVLLLAMLCWIEAAPWIKFLTLIGGGVKTVIYRVIEWKTMP